MRVTKLRKRISASLPDCFNRIPGKEVLYPGSRFCPGKPRRSRQSPASKLLAQGTVVYDSPHCLGDLLHRCRIHEQRRISGNFRQGAGIGGCHRSTARHRFQHGQSETFIQRHKYQRFGAAVKRGQLPFRNHANKVNPRIQVLPLNAFRKLGCRMPGEYQPRLCIKSGTRKSLYRPGLVLMTLAVAHAQKVGKRKRAWFMHRAILSIHSTADIENFSRRHSGPINDSSAREFRDRNDTRRATACPFQKRGVVQALERTAIFGTINMIEIMQGEDERRGAIKGRVIARRKEQVITGQTAERTREAQGIQRRGRT